VAPGTIDTHLLRTNPAIAAASEGFRKASPLRRLGKPSEIADAVAWLGLGHVELRHRHCIARGWRTAVVI
jgi:NAD(P)-dependent dehydrogenase (short-subunit alcohol dehydrogenase family)